MTLAVCVGAPLAGAAAIALLGRWLGRRAAVAVAGVALALALAGALAMTQAFADGRTSVVVELGRWMPLRGSALALTATPAALAPLFVASLAPAALLMLQLRGAEADVRRAALGASLAAAALALLATATDLLLVIAGWQICGLASARLRDRSAATARLSAAWRAGGVVLLLAVAAYVALFTTNDVAEIVRRVDPSLPPEAVGRVTTALLVPSALVVVGLLIVAVPAVRAAIARGRGTARRADGAALALVTVAAAMLLARLGPLLHPGALAAGGVALAVSALAPIDVGRSSKIAAALARALEAGIEATFDRAAVVVATALRGASGLASLEERSGGVRTALMLAAVLALLAFWSLQ